MRGTYWKSDAGNLLEVGCGELTGSRMLRDLDFSSNLDALTVHLTRSKTDTTGSGTDISVGRCDKALICPVKLMVEYTAFRAVGNGSLFIYHNQQPLTRQAITRELRILLPSCGVFEPQSYTCHSFCIGAATSTARAGVLDHLIRHMGRWRSDTILRYIRVHLAEVLQVSQKLCTVSGLPPAPLLLVHNTLFEAYLVLIGDTRLGHFTLRTWVVLSSSLFSYSLYLWPSRHSVTAPSAGRPPIPTSSALRHSLSVLISLALRHSLSLSLC